MQRDQQISQLTDSNQVWDVTIIGGGATGLAAALDSASRGLKTLLLEAADFAESTSSKSTKLIHGGVRYLRGGEISLVKEALHERGHLLKNAPNIVKPLAFIVPAYRWYDRIYYGTGLSLYDFLAGKRAIESTGHFSLDKTLAASPNLNPDGLRGSTHYWDAQFDDARLAIAMAKTAHKHGATVLNHCRVIRLQKTNEKISGVVVQDSIAGQEYEIKSKAVVNATGVFTDSIRQMDDAELPNIIVPSQGIHIVLDRDFLDSDTGIMIPETDDGRVLFAIPWLNRVILGTTDTPDVPVELNPEAQQAEIDYLVEHAGRFLKRAPSHSDIRATFAGLRPLVKPPANKGSTSGISRKHSLFVSPSGLVTITGGKWTTCRSMAEATIDRTVEIHDSLNASECKTRDLRLMDESTAQQYSELDQPLDKALPYTMADVAAAVRDELAETVDDVLARRTRCLFLDQAASQRCAPKIAEWMAAEKQKPDSWTREQLSILDI